MKSSKLMEKVARYTVVLEREPDGGYVATIPVLPGCVSQGDTREEALDNIREAIELYIEDCIAAGESVPEEAEREFVDLRIGDRQWISQRIFQGTNCAER
jgi:antitoxin HicB